MLCFDNSISVIPYGERVDQNGSRLLNRLPKKPLIVAACHHLGVFCAALGYGFLIGRFFTNE
jgi:hypothetical protein